MKKILLFSLLFISLQAYADQWYVLNYQQAVEAKNLLDQQSQVISYCGCCDNSPKEQIDIQKVKIEKWEGSKKNENLYYIKIDGYNSTANKPFSEGVDLAYIHLIKTDGLAYNVANELSLEVDSCTDPFSFKIKNNKKIKNRKKDKSNKNFSLNNLFHFDINSNKYYLVTPLSI